MKINSNILAISAERSLAGTGKALGRALERLSTGKRINRAQDDASGLAISNGLDAQLRGSTRAAIDINQSSALLQTADAAIASQLEIVQRMRELSLQAANGTMASTDRTYINLELKELLKEFDRVSNQANFNGTNLLDGSFETKTIQVGADLANRFSMNIGDLRTSKVFSKQMGSGKFNVGTTNGAKSYGVATEDINGDGHQDMISSTAGGSGPANVLLGRGDGTFYARSTINFIGTAPGTIVDINGDGKKDFVGVGGQIIGYATIALGNGDGTFKAASTLSGLWIRYGGNVSVADFNNDGKMDITTADGDFQYLSVWIGNGDGTFQTRTTKTLAGAAVGTSTATADYNRDGWMDIAASNGGNVAISLNNGDGTFAAITNYAAGTTGMAIRTADLDGDGDSDIIQGNSGGGGTVSVLLNNGNGTFAAATNYTGGGGGVELKDIDNDGVLDIAVRGTASVSFLRGNGNGTFQLAATSFATASMVDFAMADFNDDGVQDLAAADNSTGGLYTYLAMTQTRAADYEVDVSTQAKAQNLLEILDDAITTLSGKRSDLGALQNRLESSLSVTQMTGENVSAAKSQILDTDVSSETAELTRNQILQQSGVAVLAQANSQMQTLLSLLKKLA